MRGQGGWGQAIASRKPGLQGPNRAGLWGYLGLAPTSGKRLTNYTAAGGNGKTALDQSIGL